MHTHIGVGTVYILREGIARYACTKNFTRRLWKLMRQKVLIPSYESKLMTAWMQEIAKNRATCRGLEWYKHTDTLAEVRSIRMNHTNGHLPEFFVWLRWPLALCWDSPYFLVPSLVTLVKLNKAYSLIMSLIMHACIYAYIPGEQNLV